MMLDYRPDKRTFEYSTLDVCQGYTPVDSGYAVSPGGTPLFSTMTLDGDCLGARSIKTESGSIRLFFGSASKIEEIVKTTSPTAYTLTNRSKSGGYTTGSNRWWFTQGLGNAEVIATNYADAMQISTGTTFGNLSNAPKAKIVLAQSNALLALNYDDGTAVPNGIKTSDRGSSTTWTPSSSNDATSLKLVETPGEIVAGATLHDIVIAWKRSSMYVGRFVGGDEKWQFNLLSPNVGCYGMESWCATPAGIVFAGEAGVYLFDGSVPRPIDQGIRQTIQYHVGEINDFGKNVTFGADEFLGCVFMYIPDPNSTTNFVSFAYNYKTDRWSLAYPYYNDGVTYSGTNWGYANYSDFQTVIRDLTVVDLRRFITTLGYTDNTGHCVVTGEKKLLTLNNRNTSVSDVDVSGVAAYLSTDKFRLAQWDKDVQVKRVQPEFVNVTYQNDPSPGANMYCTLGGKTFTWDSSAKRFDGFATGKQFFLLFGSSDTRYAVQSFFFDFQLSGKT